MDDVGFDGKVHKEPPSIGPIFVALFAISVFYWIACQLLLSPQLLAQLMFPIPGPNWLLAFVLNWLPVGLTLGAAAAFQLPRKLEMSWWVFCLAGMVFDGLARFVVLMFCLLI